MNSLQGKKEILNQWQFWQVGKEYAEGEHLGLFPPFFITGLFCEIVCGQKRKEHTGF